MHWQKFVTKSKILLQKIKNKTDHFGRLDFWCGRRECIIPMQNQTNRKTLGDFAGPLSLRYRFVPNPLYRVLFRRRNPIIKPAQSRLNSWCGRRESNPRLQLGKLTCYHYTTPAVLCILYKSFLNVYEYFSLVQTRLFLL